MSLKSSLGAREKVRLGSIWLATGFGVGELHFASGREDKQRVDDLSLARFTVAIKESELQFLSCNSKAVTKNNKFRIMRVILSAQWKI